MPMKRAEPRSAVPDGAIGIVRDDTQLEPEANPRTANPNVGRAAAEALVHPKPERPASIVAATTQTNQLQSAWTTR